MLRRRGGDQGDPALFEEVVTEQLLDEVPREPVRRLDDDGARAIGQQRRQHTRELRALVDWIGAGNGHVVERGDIS